MKVACYNINGTNTYDFVFNHKEKEQLDAYFGSPSGYDIFEEENNIKKIILRPSKDKHNASLYRPPGRKNGIDEYRMRQSQAESTSNKRKEAFGRIDIDLNDKKCIGGLGAAVPVDRKCLIIDLTTKTLGAPSAAMSHAAKMQRRHTTALVATTASTKPQQTLLAAKIAEADATLRANGKLPVVAAPSAPVTVTPTPDRDYVDFGEIMSRAVALPDTLRRALFYVVRDTLFPVNAQGGLIG